MFFDLLITIFSCFQDFFFALEKFGVASHATDVKSLFNHDSIGLMDFWIADAWFQIAVYDKVD